MLVSNEKIVPSKRNTVCKHVHDTQHHTNVQVLAYVVKLCDANATLFAGLTV